MNKKQNNRARMIVISFGVVFCLSIPSLVFLYFDAQDSAWGRTACIVSYWAMIVISIWIYNSLEERIRGSYTWSHRFYPPVNEKIERLFDDYLWKRYMEKEAKFKEEEERKRIRKQIRNWSHPDLETFLNVVENELKNPSETCAFGDVEFGMTPEDVYKTKTFSGLDRDSKEVYLGYRGNFLGHYFGINGNTHTKFHFESDRLDKVTIIPINGGYRYKPEIVEPFIACCKVLSQIYGNPRNLCKRYMSNKLELWPHDKVVFAAGKKCVQLLVGGDFPHYIIMIEFSQKQQANQDVYDINCEFSEGWFDDMRREYNKPYSIPDYPNPYQSVF